MNDFNPPPNPSADAIQAASALIALVADPAGAKKRLAGLVAVHEDIRQAHLALQDERKKLIDENARSSDLRAKETLLANKQTDLERAALAQAVAATALEAREQKLAAAEYELKNKQSAHAADVAALSAKVANMKSALG
jgi:hypothetical protein